MLKENFNELQNLSCGGQGAKLLPKQRANWVSLSVCTQPRDEGP